MVLCYILFLKIEAHALVKYDEGQFAINGIQLFQDYQNPNAYYYLPPYPRLSTLSDGSFEFLCMKYMSLENEEARGGLFHALIQFSLLEEEEEALEEELKKKFPEAEVMGPVQMMDSVEDGEEGLASFRIVSSVLSKSDAENPFEVNVVTSGRAPFLPGSKAAVAAQLNPYEARLLWETFQSKTSDVSIVVEGYFEAITKGYNAVVRADLEIVYDHLSTFENQQEGFSREQLRQALDSLAQEGDIQIEVLDRSASLGVKTEAMQEILNLVTEKVIDLMFNAKSGWAKLPERPQQVVPDKVPGKYKRGAFVSFFAGDGAQPYIPDNQYLLKEKKEIRNFHFFLNLSQSTTIKVPVYSAGNINGFYGQYKEEEQYFKVVYLDDPIYQSRELQFVVDGAFLESYNDIINFAAVNVRKRYTGDDPVFTSDLRFYKRDITEGRFIQSLEYPRRGQKEAEWMEYEYKVAWSITGKDTMLSQPPEAEQWIKADMNTISLSPPFHKTSVEIESDREAFLESGVKSATIRFASILFGKAQRQRMVLLRVSDDASPKRVAVYHDPGEAIAYKVTWYSNKGAYEEQLKLLENQYLFLVPPSEEVFDKN